MEGLVPPSLGQGLGRDLVLPVLFGEDRRRVPSTLPLHYPLLRHQRGVHCVLAGQMAPGEELGGVFPGAVLPRHQATRYGCGRRRVQTLTAAPPLYGRRGRPRHRHPGHLRHLPAGRADGRVIDSATAPAFSSRAAYRALSPARPLDASACTAWSSRLPTKLKVFVYLADIDRLSSRANLFFKNCAQTDQCAACPAVETGRHLLFDCPVAVAVWALVGSHPPSPGSSLWDTPAPAAFGAHVWQAGIVVLLWNVWKARNDLVFNARTCTPADIIRRSCDDLSIWRWRFPLGDRAGIDALRSFFLSRLM
jgi:hypothetical protein